MKKILPLMLLVPCIAMGANNSHKATSKATITITNPVRNGISQAPVKGVVKDETGAASPGVSVIIKGTSKGTRTDANGSFSLDAAPGDVLVFTFVGYVKKEVTVGNNTDYVISLVPNPNSLNEVVVTALGVKRSEKSIAYATRLLMARRLTTLKTTT